MPLLLPDYPRGKCPAHAARLHEELAGYPAGNGHHEVHGDEIAVPLRFRAGDEELAFFSTVAAFATAVDITISELAIEAFFPADAATAEYLQRLPLA
jgi:hypothetical protein